MEEKVYVEDDSEIQTRRPDVHVVENVPEWLAQAGEVSTAVLDEPVQLSPIVDPIRQRTVLIYDEAGKRVVTAIEILSPWNKTPGKPLETYMQKRKKYVARQINRVEIGLIRTGDWTQMVGRYHIPEHLRTTYRVTINHHGSASLYLYAIEMDAKLPTIKIPLRAKDAPAKLNLQELVEKAYQMGRYDRIDYSRRCYPYPTPEEAAWFEQALKKSKPR